MKIIHLRGIFEKLPEIRQPNERNLDALQIDTNYAPERMAVDSGNSRLPE
jgi:hypothetical protein